MEFRILGPLELVDDGAPVALPRGRKQRALLLDLVVHANEVVGTDQLVEDVWADAAPATATKVVQLYVSQLRKVVGARLMTQSPGYVLRIEDGELDAARAQALGEQAREAEPVDAARLLREALALWRGPPLAEAAYLSFAQVEIAWLEDLRVRLLEQRVEADLALGRHADLVGELTALVSEHPLREGLRAQLMLALYRSGRQAEALSQYADARRALTAELGLEPDERLQDLQRRILAHDPTLDAPRPPRRPVHRRPRIVATAAAVVIAAVVVGVALRLSSSDAAVTIRANSVAVVDATTSRVVDDVPVGSRPLAATMAEGALWVASGDDDVVSRIDPRSRSVTATIGVGGDVTDVAGGYGSIWVAGGTTGTITRIDPDANAVADAVSTGPGAAVDPVSAIATGAGAVWALRGDHVLRVDPSAGRVVARVPLRLPMGVAADDHAVWVTTGDERLVRIDPATNTISDSIELPALALSPAVGNGAVWAILLLRPAAIWRVDPSGPVTRATVSVHAPIADLAIGSDAVWATSATGGLWRLDPEAGAPSLTVLGHRPADVVLAEGHIWVPIADSAS